MNLYIEIEDGQAKNHPAFEDNLLQAFGRIPDHWEPFARTEKPSLGIYQVFDEPEFSYSKVNGVWTEVWAVRNMTAEEVVAKQEAAKTAWANLLNRDNYSAWSFDDSLCVYVAPTPYPSDGKHYFWQGTTNSWVELPTHPTDGQKYRLDFATAQWVLVAL